MRIFRNGIFISCDERDNVYKYLVEDRGKIIFLGNELPDKYAQSKAVHVDLQGRAVIPVLADTHIHFGSFALFHFGLNLRYAGDFEEMRNIIKDYERKHRKARFLMGFGISSHTVKENRLPDRKDLDHMTDKPILIVKYDGHAAVANSALIQDFPDEVRKADGFDEETGWLYRDAFYKGVNFVSSYIKPFSLLNSMVKAADYMAKKGIGLIHAVEGNGFKNDADFDAVNFVTRAFPQYFRLYFQTMTVEKVIKRKLTRIGGCFATALDGCFGSEDAALSRPYNNKPDNYGKLFYSQGEVNSFVKKANRAGMQVALHAVGDAAVEQAINAFEEALADYPRSEHRHIIIHADLISGKQIERAARLNLHIAVQPEFLHWREEPASYLESILGERANNILPLRDMLDAGLVVGGGSDAPCTLPHPFTGIWAACNHPNLRQRVKVAEALKMYTSMAARLSFDEHITGSLKEGLSADFVVLDRNPLTIPVEDLKNIQVEEVYFKGKCYEGLPASILTILAKAFLNR